ncbi:hypothetical protein C1H46_003769 [Malus baccata]|uniref:Uncharacterized protein n=1 Tax=Malus baccata TaxID=106549 RepID=A0A540NI01_MALBA|nr:hypothetical protein C1H46_003769 [Malus baccata]
MKNITQHISRLVRLDDASINSLNAMAIKVLIDVDVHLPLKRVLVVNGDKELPTFISYNNMFEVCFYCGRHTIKNQDVIKKIKMLGIIKRDDPRDESRVVSKDHDRTVSHVVEAPLRKRRQDLLDASWFMVNKVFGDEPNLMSEGFNDSNLTLGDLDNDLIVCFPQPPRAVTYSGHSRVCPDHSKMTVSWSSRKRRRKNKGDSEDESGSEGEGAGLGASGVDGLGAKK